MAGKTGRLRFAATALLLLSLLSLALPSAADPADDVNNAKANLEAARGKLADLQREMTQLVEDFNFARVQLAATEQELADTQAILDKASSAASEARDALNARAALAYTGGTASTFEVILDAGSITDLTDRLEFLNELAANDANLAQRAEVTAGEAQLAREQLETIKARQKEELAKMAAAKEAIAKNIDQQAALVDKYELQYEEALQAQREAERQARLAAEQQTGGGTPTSGNGGSWNPPTSSGAAGAVQAARSMIGKPYVWGAANPNVGFDCSGLTSWAWGQVGVYLPHSSSAQYASLPKVSRDNLQPGDLLFFYSPISHVAMYTGGNSMVHASNPSVPVQEIGIADYWWDKFVGAARPG